MEMIKTQDLAFTYPGTEDQVNTRALRGVDVTIERGSFVVILGHNGSGKSTLAKTFNAVLLPSGGKVYVEGMDTMDESLLLEIRRRVGMVFQNPDNQIVANVVEEDVAFAPENLGVPSAEIRKRVDDALEAVGMTQFVKHAPHLLSGGQKQRIAIAGVLAMKPECIVLDEATAMLDPIGRREVLAAVEKLNREQGITVVLITPVSYTHRRARRPRDRDERRPCRHGRKAARGFHPQKGAGGHRPCRAGHGLAALFPARGGDGRPRGCHHRRGMRRRHCEKFYLRGL